MATLLAANTGFTEWAGAEQADAHAWQPREQLLIAISGWAKLTAACMIERPARPSSPIPNGSTGCGSSAPTMSGHTGESMLVGWTDATTRLGVAGADMFAVRFVAGGLGSGPDRRPARRGERARARGRDPRARSTGAIGDTLGRVFTVFDALAAVAVLIAALGIVNTLTINVIERVREIGILRAAGMTRRQVWRSVVVEAGVLGLAGALLGVVLGLAVGGLMVVLAGGRIDLGWRHAVGRDGLRRRPRCGRRDARGGLSGAHRESPVHRAGRPLRVSRC